MFSHPGLSRGETEIDSRHQQDHYPTQTLRVTKSVPLLFSSRLFILLLLPATPSADHQDAFFSVQTTGQEWHSTELSVFPWQPFRQIKAIFRKRDFEQYAATRKGSDTLLRYG